MSNPEKHRVAVRTFYGDDEVAAVARITGARQSNRKSGPPAEVVAQAVLEES